MDRYTLLGSGHPYHDSHWIFQILLALFHDAGGMVGVQVFTAGLWLIILALTLLSIRRWVPLPVALLVGFVVMMACIERFLPRPELVTSV